jgi:hypothetical protein
VNSVDGLFGNANDGASLNGMPGPKSKIASVFIKGAGSGTAASSSDHFGIVAEEIVKVGINGVKFILRPGPGNDDLTATSPLLLVGPTNDFRIREVPI